MNEPIEEVQNVPQWVQEEAKATQCNDQERIPALKLEEGKINTFTVDFSKPFNMWQDTVSGSIKKIIPVTQNEVKMNLWLNVANPLYSQIIQKGNKGQTLFKVIRTGKLKETKYTLVE
jgi:hypothetical protein